MVFNNEWLNRDTRRIGFGHLKRQRFFWVSRFCTKRPWFATKFLWLQLQKLFKTEVSMYFVVKYMKICKTMHKFVYWLLAAQYHYMHHSCYSINCSLDSQLHRNIFLLSPLWKFVSWVAAASHHRVFCCRHCFVHHHLRCQHSHLHRIQQKGCPQQR